VRGERGRGVVVLVTAVVTAVVATSALAGCGGEPPAALHVDVCVGADRVPASGTVVVALVQGGKQVAMASGSGAGSDMGFGFTVPELPTAVLLDGQPFGYASGPGGADGVDPTSTDAPAPTDEQVEAAGRATPTTTIGIATPGCSLAPEPPSS